jgi:citrate lyase alpha subunit
MRMSSNLPPLWEDERDNPTSKGGKASTSERRIRISDEEARQMIADIEEEFRKHGQKDGYDIQGYHHKKRLILNS